MELHEQNTHRLSGSTHTNIYFSTFYLTEVQIGVPSWLGSGGNPLLIYNSPPAYYNFTWQRKHSIVSLLVRALIPFMRAHSEDLIISQRFHLQIPSHCRLELQYGWREGHKHLLHNLKLTFSFLICARQSTLFILTLPPEHVGSSCNYYLHLQKRTLVRG